MKRTRSGRVLLNVTAFSLKITSVFGWIHSTTGGGRKSRVSIRSVSSKTEFIEKAEERISVSTSFRIIAPMQVLRGGRTQMGYFLLIEWAPNLVPVRRYSGQTLDNLYDRFTIRTPGRGRNSLCKCRFKRSWHFAT
ncbi:MAG: hypothetical protein C4324_08575 [Blastocatellia bacterium]